MNAQFRSLQGQMILGEARNSEEMLEIWRARKTTVGLSNRTFDELANFGAGHVDKILGPTGSKSFGPVSFSKLNWALAVKWIAVVDLEHAEFMAAHWADRQRDVCNVRIEPNRVSKQIIERARPIVLKQFGEKLALALGDDLGQVLLGMKPDQGDPNTEPVQIESPAPVIKDAAKPAMLISSSSNEGGKIITACEPAKLAAPLKPAPASRASAGSAA
jgi:hypothetical protein